MNYEECLEYIHSVNWCFCKPGLERIAELCERLGNPQNKLKFIHIAGTNGKGSVCAMLSSVLVQAGYRVGLYTSPYITVFNERMRINGKNIDNEELIRLTEKIKPIADSMSDKPTEFELITALAFEYFSDNACDVVVLEAGMGGRLDSTNIISSESTLLSVITGIALDHTAYLGETIPLIAKEKAGIIKKGVPVLFGGTDKTAAEVIKEKASAENSDFYTVDYSRLEIRKMTLEGSNFDFGDYKNMGISLLGGYQPRNASIVLSSIDILKEKGFKINKNTIQKGLELAVWQGRFEIISKEPLIIFDGAHNPEGISASVASIKHYFKGKKVYIVSGVLKDKDYTVIAKELSAVASRAFTITPDSPRALDAKEYASVLNDAGIFAEAGDEIVGTFEKAKAQAMKDGVPLICLGSLYVYSSIK